MNILYVINQYPKISHTFIRREIEAIVDLDVDVQRFSIRPPPEDLIDSSDLNEFEKTYYVLKDKLSVFLLFKNIFKSALKAGLKCFFTSFVFFVRFSFSSELPIYKNLAYYLEALTIFCEADSADHIHAHFGTNSCDVAMYLSILMGVDYSFTVHGADELDNVSKYKIPEKIKRASKVFFVCNFLKAQFMRNVSLNEWEKLKVVKCGVKINANPSLSFEDKNNDFVIIGRFCIEKGYPDLFKAISYLKNNNRLIDGAVFNIVGDGELNGYFKDLIRELGIGDAIRFHGWKDEAFIDGILKESRFFVLPSLMEGLPVSIMEAVNNRAVVVSSYVSGIPELIINKETGFLVKCLDSQGLANIIDYMLRIETEEFYSISESAFRLLSQEHDILKNSSFKLSEMS